MRRSPGPDSERFFAGDMAAASESAACMVENLEVWALRLVEHAASKILVPFDGIAVSGFRSGNGLQRGRLVP